MFKQKLENLKSMLVKNILIVFPGQERRSRGVSESLCLNRNGKAEPGDQKINPSKKYFGQCFHVYGDLSNMRASSLNY